MKIGNLFKYKVLYLRSLHGDLDGCVGIVLSEPNSYGQYKALVVHKVLYIFRAHMEKL